MRGSYTYLFQDDTSTISIPITVLGLQQTLDSYSNITKDTADGTYQIPTPVVRYSGSVIENYLPTYSYQSSDTTVATVDANGLITMLKAGTTTITVYAKESANYEDTSTTFELTVTGEDVTPPQPVTPPEGQQTAPSAPVNNYSKMNGEIMTLIENAEQGGTVTYNMGEWISIMKGVFIKLQEREDVTLVLNFDKDGNSVTIPAGKALDEEYLYYGYLYLELMYGFTPTK